MVKFRDAHSQEAISYQAELFRRMHDDEFFYKRYKVHKLATWFPDLLRQPQNILDFGCGAGVMCYYMRYYFNCAKVFGVDVSEGSIAGAKKNFKHVTFTKIFDRIEFPDQFFDIISASEVFHHICQQEHKFWIKELVRVLKPGGIFVIFERNPLNLLVLRSFWKEHKKIQDGSVSVLWPWYTRSLLADFGQVETTFFNFFSMHQPFFKGLESWLGRLPFGKGYATILRKKNQVLRPGTL